MVRVLSRVLGNSLQKSDDTWRLENQGGTCELGGRTVMNWESARKITNDFTGKQKSRDIRAEERRVLLPPGPSVDSRDAVALPMSLLRVVCPEVPHFTEPKGSWPIMFATNASKQFMNCCLAAEASGLVTAIGFTLNPWSMPCDWTTMRSLLSGMTVPMPWLIPAFTLTHGISTQEAMTLELGVVKPKHQAFHPLLGKKCSSSPKSEIMKVSLDSS